MNRWLLTAVAGAALVLSVVPDEDVGACSIVCSQGRLEVELVEVRLIEAADPEAPAPDSPTWARTAEIQGYGEMWFDDGTSLSLYELSPTEVP